MATLPPTPNHLIHGLTADSFLGPSSTRYFSSAFKDVDHCLHNLQFEQDTLFAELTVKWPPMWSKKNGKSLHPHIGTLDFFLTAARLTGIYLSHIGYGQAELIAKMWISGFSCKTGCGCIEQDTVPCSCRLASETYDTISFEINIASTSVSLQILLPDDLPLKTQNPFHSGFCNSNSYYTGTYKQAAREISNIQVNTREQYISADFELKHTALSLFEGLGSLYMPCITFCDMVLVAGQLSQILLFESDHTSREKASNLWLRKIQCNYNVPIIGKTNITVSVKNSKTIKLKDSYYHCSDLIFNFSNGSLMAECSAAYQPTVQ